MAKEYNYIEQITPLKENMTIKIRIVRLWKPPSYNNSNEDGSIEMVFLDEKGGKIQASVKKSLIGRFSNVLEEGQLRMITNFGVGQSTGNYKPTQHPYKINFFFTTIVDVCDNLPIPRYGFNFVSFDTILSKQMDDNVIGQIVVVGPLETNDRNRRPSKKIMMELTDNKSAKLKCTLWDTFAEEVANYISERGSNPIITIIQFAKIKEWKELLHLSEAQLKNYTLAEIEKILAKNGSSLKRFPDLPYSNDMTMSEGNNKLIQEELHYDRSSLQVEYNSLFSNLTNEQREVYGTIMHAVSSGQGGVFFIYGHGGTGKTFIWRTLSAALRSKGEIVLTVASSGIVSLLLIGGRTAHSRFAIPINVNEDSTCNIRPGTELAELLIKTKLIIWDEATMVHKYCFEALDKSLRDILRSTNPNSMETPFGGKVVVFGGDFRQILPVIPKGSRQDIVFSTLNSSYLWNFCKVLRLTRNMRLQNECADTNINETREFSEWILKVGDGCVGKPNDGEAEIDIPNDILITDTSDPLASIVDFTYPSMLNNLMDNRYFQERAILAPTNEIVENVNEYLLAKVDGEEKVYLSSDSICNGDSNTVGNSDIYTPDLLNSIKCSGSPNHKLKLKVGVPVINAHQKHRPTTRIVQWN